MAEISHFLKLFSPSGKKGYQARNFPSMKISDFSLYKRGWKAVGKYSRIG